MGGGIILGFLGITQRVDIKGVMKLCLCGCGQEVKPENVFIRFHQWRGKFSPSLTRVKSLEERTKISLSKTGELNPAKRQEVRDKISQKAKLRWQDPGYWVKMSNVFKKKIGHKNPFFGKKHSPESIKKMMEKRKYHYGEDHHWFKPNRQSKYPLEWTTTFKRAIRERDNYKCQRCGIPQEECLRELDIHHKDGIKTNCDPKNLIALCVSCHMKIEHNPKYQGELK